MPILPSKSVCYHASTEATQHASNGKYGDSQRVQQLHRVILNVLSIATLVHIFHEILYVLQHTQNITYTLRAQG